MDLDVGRLSSKQDSKAPSRFLARNAAHTVCSSRLHGAAGYSSSSGSAFDPRLQQGLPPTRQGSRTFGTDTRGMQSLTSPAWNLAPKRHQAPSTPKDAGSAGFVQSPYLATKLSQRRSAQASLKSAYSSLSRHSRPPTAPTPKGKAAKKPSPVDEITKIYNRKGNSHKASRPASVPAEFGSGHTDHHILEEPEAEQKSSKNKFREDTNFKDNSFGDKPQAWDGVNTSELEESGCFPENSKAGLAVYPATAEEASADQGYGMTLREYISNMTTTPAARSNFTDFRNEQWTSIPIQGFSTYLVPGDDDSKKHADLCSDSSDHSTALEENLPPAALSPTPSSLLTASSSPLSQSSRNQGGVDFSNAVCNELDLRPATAFQDSGLLSALNGSQQDGETKEVDLGSLSAELFSFHYLSNNKKSTSILQPGMERRPASANLWAKTSCKRSMHQQESVTQDSNTKFHINQGQETHSSTRANESSASFSRPGRKIHSARPARQADRDISPSVWQQLTDARRPPSRQKPPPEALHLFSNQTFGNVTKGIPPRRPKTCASVQHRPSSALCVPHDADLSSSGGLRPPSRQKPPPQSLGLEQGSPRPTKAFKQIFVSDSDDDSQGYLSPKNGTPSTPDS